jgi:hypothetical protein
LRGLGLALVTIIACRPVPTIQTRTYEPGEKAAKLDDLGVELLSATYDERQLTVVIDLQNVGNAPATIERSGLLLAYEQLEFPARQTTAAQTLELPAGGSERLTLSFETGTSIMEEAELIVRAARRGETWLDPVRLTIPPAPDVVVED